MNRRDRLALAVFKAGAVRKMSVGNRVVAAVIAEIGAIVRAEGRFEVRGMGVFYLQKLPEGTRHNPATMVKHRVPERWVIKFKAGRKFRGRGEP